MNYLSKKKIQGKNHALLHHLAVKEMGLVFLWFALCYALLCLYPSELSCQNVPTREKQASWDLPSSATPFSTAQFQAELQARGPVVVQYI